MDNLVFTLKGPGVITSKGKVKLWNGKEVSKIIAEPFTDEKLIAVLKRFEKLEPFLNLAIQCPSCRKNLKKYLYLNWRELNEDIKYL